MTEVVNRQKLILNLREALSVVYDTDDEIYGCGDAVLQIIRARPTEVIRLAHEKLHAFPWRDVPTCWRRAYTDGALWKSLQVIETSDLQMFEHETVRDAKSKSKEKGAGEDWIQQVVRLLDMAVILTGAPRREGLIEDVFNHLEAILTNDENPLPPETNGQDTSSPDAPPSKRQKFNDRACSNNLETTFSSAPAFSPPIKHPIPRVPCMSLSSFQTHILQEPATPIIITDALNQWPALSIRPWKDPLYLLSRTLGGRRLVPVEIGRSYTDEGWSQKIMTFGDFMREHMLDDSPRQPGSCSPVSSEVRPEKSTEAKKPKPTVYLAQHPLFTQIPRLRADISIPDYCYTSPPPPPNRSSSPSPETPELAEPILNAWFGPRSTISPLHTDPHHNILTQVVGYKYVRLYAPSETHLLAPRGVGADGVDLGNTSSVDVDAMMKVVEGVDWGEEAGEEGDGNGFGRAVEAKYVEGVLGPGECMWIPTGWWHYVRSLSGSFSVSFWWD